MSLLARLFFPPSKFYIASETRLMDSNLHALTQVMGKKKKRRVEKVAKTPEQKETSFSNVVRRHDLLGNPETADSMAKAIRAQLSLVSRGHITRRHIARFRKYKALAELGRTHDYEHSLGSSFVTPLTRLQHESRLPSTMDQVRHDFPHVLHYSVDWYGASRPSPFPPDSRCFVTFNFRDLELSTRQLQGLKEILGPMRIDPESGLCLLESDLFGDLNQNAAYLGDITEKLIRVVRGLR